MASNSDSSSPLEAPTPTNPAEDPAVKKLQAFFCQSEHAHRESSIRLSLDGFQIYLFNDMDEVLSCFNIPYFSFPYWYKRKTWKFEMIKILKRREECNTYLAHVCRHHCSRESLVKRWNIRSFQLTLWHSSAVDVDSIYFFFSPGFLRSLTDGRW